MEGRGGGRTRGRQGGGREEKKEGRRVRGEGKKKGKKVGGDPLPLGGKK